MSKKSTVELINIFGQVVLSSNIIDQLKMDVSEVVPGIYFLKVDDGVESFVFKVVKE